MVKNMKINRIDIISSLIVAAIVAVLVYMGNDIRYDMYVILWSALVAVIAFVAGFYEAKKRYS